MPDTHDHADQGEGQDQGDAEGGFLLDQGDQRGGSQGREGDVLDRRAARRQVAPRQQPRGCEDKAKLGEFRGLDLEAAWQGDPRLRAVHRLADGEDGEEEQQGQAVQDRGPAPDPTVVDRRRDEHQDQAEDRPEGRLRQVRVRVEARLAQLRLGRRPDEHRAEDGQRAGDKDQRPVPGPGDAALGERPREGRPVARCERAGPRAGPATGREADAHLPPPLVIAARFGSAGRLPPGMAAFWP